MSVRLVSGSSKPLPNSKMPLGFHFKPTTKVTTFVPATPTLDRTVSRPAIAEVWQGGIIDGPSARYVGAYGLHFGAEGLPTAPSLRGGSSESRSLRNAGQKTRDSATSGSAIAESPTLNYSRGVETGELRN